MYPRTYSNRSTHTHTYACTPEAFSCLLDVYSFWLVMCLLLKNGQVFRQFSHVCWSEDFWNADWLTEHWIWPKGRHPSIGRGFRPWLPWSSVRKPGIGSFMCECSTLLEPAVGVACRWRNFFERAHFREMGAWESRRFMTHQASASLCSPQCLWSFPCLIRRQWDGFPGLSVWRLLCRGWRFQDDCCSLALKSRNDDLSCTSESRSKSIAEKLMSMSMEVNVTLHFIFWLGFFLHLTAGLGWLFFLH